MKSFLLLVILVVIGILAYNYFVDTGPVTEDEKELKALENDFETALKQMQKAGRMAGLSGMDTTSEAEDVINGMERIKENLIMLKNRLKEGRLLKRADGLEERIKRFLRENR